MVSSVFLAVVVIAALIVVVGFYACCMLYVHRLLLSEERKEDLAEWERRLTLASPDERDYLRAHPPIEVLEAIFAVPSPRQRWFSMTIHR